MNNNYFTKAVFEGVDTSPPQVEEVFQKDNYY